MWCHKTLYFIAYVSHEYTGLWFSRHRGKWSVCILARSSCSHSLEPAMVRKPLWKWTLWFYGIKCFSFSHSWTVCSVNFLLYVYCDRLNKKRFFSFSELFFCHGSVWRNSVVALKNLAWERKTVAVFCA